MRSQLDKARAEKDSVEEQLQETQTMLSQQQLEHKSLVQSRAREMEQWTDEREKSLSLVEEMSKEVKRAALNYNTVQTSSYCKCIVVVLWLGIKLLFINIVTLNGSKNDQLSV